MKDLKYLAAYCIPLTALIGVMFRGPWVFLTPVFGFVIIPLLELIFPVSNENLSSDEAEDKSKDRLFDWLLYLNLPVVYGILFYTLFVVVNFNIEGYEFIGLALSIGTVLGVNGINVGHELGHRLSSPERFLGKALFVPAFYMHFFIEHNFGHHLNAATIEDPATARYNQSVYSFWFTSIFGKYSSAWKIQLNLLKKKGRNFFSLKNDMLYYVIIQALYIIGVWVLFGPKGVIFAIIAAIVGMLLLETVNYLEHYGLLRKKLDSGRYERVKEIHSWNSNHIMGRIVLYELTRHSDHHYKSNKKYQLLDCHEDSPQMPFGYPTSMVLAMIPHLWFRIMNKRVPERMKGISAA
ncbi:MAG: alkane 1-monooxygenase [Flavobacteriaceae bacterium]|nr:alkane 1-monooxygenase [Flavobacteriaceae bacterium]